VPKDKYHKVKSVIMIWTYHKFTVHLSIWEVSLRIQLMAGSSI